MGDFIFVEIVDGLDHLLKDYAGIIFAETARLVEPVEEFSSFAETKCWKAYSETM